MRDLFAANPQLGEVTATRISSWYGPIVMNTQEQLRQAFEELQEGTFLDPRRPAPFPTRSKGTVGAHDPKYADVVRVLLARGIRVDARDGNGDTALMRARKLEGLSEAHAALARTLQTAGAVE